MKKRIDISTYLYIVVIVVIYFMGTALGLTQEFINGDFKDRIA